MNERPAAPTPSPIERYLRSLHAKFLGVEDGEVATYIPELGKADPRSFGIALATVDGHVYEVGDSRLPFTIQSISKPFVYGLALADRGKPAVLARIGVEPTGEAFNEISLESGSGRPRNPLINAGAITATSLVAGRSAEDRWSRLLSLFELYAGRPLDLDESVHRSESETGHRNRAIGHMLRNFGILDGPPDDALDLYFRQCSIAVTCRDLALMAATLAKGGLHPITGQRAIDESDVDEVLSVMTTCGMYDAAGEWLFEVGFPAKSGVAGGVLAVLPGQFGIGVFSPPLDARGNSVRGVAVCTALSSELELHSLRAARAALSPVRARFDLRHVASRRLRSEADRARLVERAREAAVFQLQGDLGFASMERVVRTLHEERPRLRCLVLDLEAVFAIAAPAERVLAELLEDAAAEGLAFAFVGLARQPRLARLLGEAVAAGRLAHFLQSPDLDAALEWCEDRLLGEGSDAGSDGSIAEELAFEDHPALRALGDVDRAVLRSLAERRVLEPRRIVVREGEPADSLWLVVAGRLDVLAANPAGEQRRLTTLGPGMSFGENALIPNARRTAFVRAEAPSICWTLPRARLEEASERAPQLLQGLLASLLASSMEINARLTRDLAAARTIPALTLTSADPRGLA